jgi:cytochrome c oxidase assembly protein subunit 11
MASTHGTTVGKLLLIVVGMFGFAFALVPLYDLLCEVTGLGGRTGGAYVYEPADTKIDTSRTVKVNFITNTSEGMVWKFWAESPVVRVHPGELTEVMFYVRNPTDRVMVAQAIPSLAPGNAAEYFHKTECFCFERQVLEPGEELEMPMRFLVAPELPQYVQTVSLSYSLFDITQFAAADIARPDA